MLKEIKRNQLKSVMDDFTSFSWGLETVAIEGSNSNTIKTIDLFDKYGVFIVGGRDGLKFYNGPSYSNEYTQPQFDKSAGRLTGVNFSTQKVSFTMGVYWVTEQEYRELIYFLHPMKVDFLTFGFEPNYGYTAKLAKIADSTRYVIGRDGDNLVYYTEIPLTFELQGEQCARGVRQYEWKAASVNKNLFSINNSNDYIQSDLSFPIEYNFSFTPSSNDSTIDGRYTMKLIAKYTDATDQEPTILTLFTLNLKNITTNQSKTTNQIQYNFKYKSDSGLLFMKKGDSDGDVLVTMQNLTDTGEKFVDSSLCNKFYIPGRFDQPEFNINNFSLELQLIKNGRVIEGSSELGDIQILAYPRTNVI